jgi:hypothetical protein
MALQAWEADLHLGTGIANHRQSPESWSDRDGGEVPRVAKSFLLKALFHSFRERTFHRSVSNLKVLVARLGGESGAMGAAIVITEKLLSEFLRNPAGGLTCLLLLPL